MTKREELIQKVRDGKAAILNDGTVEQLREVLGLCFPNDNYSPSGVWKYYYKNNSINTSLKYIFENKTFHPTISVKAFYEEEFVYGEKVEVGCSFGEYKKAIYCSKNPFGEGFIAISQYNPPFIYTFVRKLPLKTKLTHQMIADKFDIDVNNLEII